VLHAIFSTVSGATITEKYLVPFVLAAGFVAVYSCYANKCVAICNEVCDSRYLVIFQRLI